ncbi:MAG: hypothetical protein EA417_06965 [Gammaproteobacteria bacterium]|nr:MAG: hypothetical protein EA417_06965 [Gammaproteobacteria bacterium]
MKTNIVLTEYGEYRPLSARIPAFLEAFPPGEGYGIELEVKDSLALRPGLLELYRSCIEAGRNPREVGLPPFPSANSIILTAKLIRDGVVLCTASTHQVIEFEKDYEIAETRARQRLVAALGFDGGMLDEDELRSTGLGRSLSPSNSPDDSQDSPPEEPPEVSDEDVTKVTLPSAPPSSAGLTPQLQAQVEARLAQLRTSGQSEPQSPTTKAEALRFLRETAPRSNGG